MKKFLILVLPTLMMLNACQESHPSLSGDAEEILENTLFEGEENSQAPATAAPPAEDGSRSVDLEAVPGHGPISVNPALPPGHHGFQPAGDTVYQAPPTGQVQAVDSVPQLEGLGDDHTQLSGKAYEDGLQAVGSRPQISESAELTVYDPFCNCYRTGPNQDPVSVEKAPPSAQNIGEGSMPELSSSAQEDEDNDD